MSVWSTRNKELSVSRNDVTRNGSFRHQKRLVRLVRTTSIFDADKRRGDPAVKRAKEIQSLVEYIREKPGTN